MTDHFEFDALWAKAKLFINYAMDDHNARTFDERALWGSLALELLGKAALARVSPLLIATPTDDGVNLLAASGLIEGDVRFFSIKASTLYARCQRAFKPFSQRDAQQFSEARNDYLHSGAPAVSRIPEAAWWPKFWAQANILINACDEELENFVGPGRVDLVESQLAQNRLNIKHRVEMRIERARQRLAQYEADQLTTRAAAEWERSADLRAMLHYSVEEPCPACAASGTLEGDEVESHEVHYEQLSEDDFDSWVDVEVASAYFSCKRCHVVLDGYELLEEAGVSLSFSAEGDPADFIEPEYNNE